MDDLRELILEAIDAQEKSYELFNRAAAAAGTREGKAFFNFMAREELRHKKTLEAQLKALEGPVPGRGRFFRPKQRATELDMRMYAAREASRILSRAGDVSERDLIAAVDEELRIAADVQANLLPKRLPEVPGLDIAATSVPARRVGGDYYDFVYKPDAEELGLVIGDVMGKGFGAALLMANVRAAWRANYVHGLSADWILDAINKSMYTDFSDNTSFVTLFTGVYYLGSGQFIYANGGHNPGLLLRHDSDDVVELGPTGLVVGVEPRTAFHPEAVTLAEEDILFLYTDGLLDSWNRNMIRAQKLVVDHLISERGQSANDMLAAVTEPVRAAAGSLTDDASCLIIKVVGRS